MATYVTPLQKSTLVLIAYDDVPQLRLLLPGDFDKRVVDMSPEEFLDALELLMVPLRNSLKVQTRKVLYTLDYREMLARWYVLDEMLRIGARLPESEVNV